MTRRPISHPRLCGQAQPREQRFRGACSEPDRVIRRRCNHYPQSSDVLSPRCTQHYPQGSLASGAATSSVGAESNYKRVGNSKCRPAGLELPRTACWRYEAAEQSRHVLQLEGTTGEHRTHAGTEIPGTHRSSRSETGAGHRGSYRSYRRVHLELGHSVCDFHCGRGVVYPEGKRQMIATVPPCARRLAGADQWVSASNLSIGRRTQSQ